MDTLIIAEKPSVALRIAIALGDNRQRRMALNGVSYYEIERPEGKIYIAPAVGHIFTLVQSKPERGYPVLNIKWAPSFESNPKSEFTKKYLDVLRMLASKTNVYVNACDFDTEGTVIGTNVIRFTGKDGGLKHAKRMKFSTTTTVELKESFANLMPFDANNFQAGETRHMLDWLWGINFSRALTSAMVGYNNKALSIGRVQGPTLAILATREKEIAAFRPMPFWKLFITAKNVEFTHTKAEIFDEAIAEAAHKATNSTKEAIVIEIEEKEQLSRPYPPFDLTSLQLEASRVLRYDPSSTLAIAQTLYERAYISYPRTASQKLPPTLGLPKIIGEIAKNPKYEKKAKMLIEEKRFRPNEGMKADAAHPAIYPTGVVPKELSTTEQNLYDLIVQRFLSCFAGYAKLAKTRIVLNAAGEQYSTNGTKITEKGWLNFYDYANLGEKELPDFKKDERVPITKTEIRELMTQPPKRYSKAGLLFELEKRDLGTKATRASIMDTLFKRNYVDGAPIKVTDFGMSVYDALKENVSMIVEEETTRQLETDMEKIVEGKKTEEEVIDEGKRMLLDALKLFDSNKSKISEAMKKGLSETSVGLGKCPKDGGDLIVRRSKAGKQFAACANYPKCLNTFSLPQGAKVVGTGKVCELCHTPIVKVIRTGKGVFEMDLDPNCKTKDKWKSNRDKKQEEQNVIAAKQTEAPKTAKTKKVAAKPKAKKIAVKAKAKKREAKEV